MMTSATHTTVTARSQVTSYAENMTLPATEACTDDSDTGSGGVDPYVAVAIACFVLGALLIIFGILRLLYFFAEPRRKRNRFQYVLRYEEQKPESHASYSECYDNPTLWY